MKKQLILSFSIILFLLLATTGVILYAKGYQYNIKQGLIGTGLLEVTSSPEGAAVYINGNLTTATNNTINLIPGTYKVAISQDGYFSWEKDITLQKEIVSKANARLFPKYPNLESITDMGISNPVLDPTLTKIAFVASPAAEMYPKKNGIFILDMSNHQFFPIQNATTQIADDASGDTFSKAQISWSPDGKNLLATISADRQIPTTYLLDSTTLNTSPQDVTETLNEVNNTWEKEKTEKETKQLNTLPDKLRRIATDNFSILAWSLDETKILYQASTSATIPPVIIPPLKGTNTIREDRSLEQGNIYVYDQKDDKNFKILDKQTATHELDNGQIPLQWLPDSTHLIYTHDKKIEVMDFDGQNRITLYASPFVDHYVFPWPDGNKIVILTNFNNDQIQPNLYTISLK